MSEQGVTGPEHLEFVRFWFGFIAHPLLLQILEVMHCKKCTRVVVFSQSLWVNVIPVAWGVSRMILLSSRGQLPMLNPKATGESAASQQKKPRSLVSHLQQHKCCLVDHGAGISCELQERLEAASGEGCASMHSHAHMSLCAHMSHAELSREGFLLRH